MKEALYISWVGMSLVFVGLIALWGMMVVLVMFTNTKKKGLLSEEITEPGSETNDKTNLIKAAAAAVAVAQGLFNSSPSADIRNERTDFSPWQTTHRMRQISQNQSVFKRKA